MSAAATDRRSHRFRQFTEHLHIRALCGPIVGAILTGILSVAGVLAILFFTIVAAGPSIEAKFFPVLTQHLITDVGWSEDGSEICWTVETHKARQAKLLQSWWMIRYDTNRIDDLVPTLNGDALPTISLPTGINRAGPMCAKVPMIDGRPLVCTYTDAKLQSVKLYETNAIYHLQQWSRPAAIPAPPNC